MTLFTIHAADGTTIVEDADAIPLDAALARLLAAARAAWPDHGGYHADDTMLGVAAILCTITGDIARAARDHADGRATRDDFIAALEREGGNLLFTVARMLDDWEGASLPRAITAAAAAQRAYRARRPATQDGTR